MKEINISVKKSSVMHSVSLNTEYTGAKSPDASSLYDRVAVIEADEEMLSRFWKETAGMVAERFKELIISFSIDDESLEMTLELSGAFDDTLAATISPDLESAIVAGVTAGWMKIASPDKAEEWQQAAVACLNRVSSKLYHRKRPVRVA